MLKPMLSCCKIYISESRNALALNSIEQAAKLFPRVIIINKFKDEAYNRVGYTLVSDFESDPSCLEKAVSNMVKSAFQTINLERHCGSHPRLGVVDHICFHPLVKASLADAAGIARSVAAKIGHNLQVPTFLYGAAHREGRTLDVIRRELGYFKRNSEGNQWTGGVESDMLNLDPDEGPARLDRTKGVVVIGATRWVDNYNVPIFSTDIVTVRRIARRVSERGGGLKSVQAMGLVHSKGLTEVACNLLDPNEVGADLVQDQVERLAKEEGIGVGQGYFTDFPQEKIVDMYLRSVSADSC